MIRSITVTNYLGESIKLELARPEKSGFVIKSITGLGPGKSTINTTELTTTDGALYNSSRLPSRNIVISLGFLWKKSIENVRLLSYKYFPIKKPLRLLIETDSRSLEIDGYVESNEPNIFSNSEDTSISIICPKPYFYSAGEESETVTSFNGVEAAFEFPFSNESTTNPLLEISRTKTVTEGVVVYNGDAGIGIMIDIHAIGDASGISIYNVQTHETMRIDVDLVAGDDVIISTIAGSKYIRLVRDGSTTNIMHKLSKNADWFQLVHGDNIFAYSAESGKENLQVTIINRTIYEGV